MSVEGASSAKSRRNNATMLWQGPRLPLAQCISSMMQPCGLQGDNNWGDDRALYNEGQQWLNLKHLMGRVVG